MSVDDDFKKVSNFKSKNEKLAWNRRRKKIEDLVLELEPYNQQMFEIQTKRNVVLDEITELRKELVRDCVHPKDLLVHNVTHVTCKFCNHKIKCN